MSDELGFGVPADDEAVAVAHAVHESTVRVLATEETPVLAAVQLIEEIRKSVESSGELLHATPGDLVPEASLSRFLEGGSLDQLARSGYIQVVAGGELEDSTGHGSTLTDVAHEYDSWGPTISAAEVEALERKNLHLQVAQRREQLMASFTRAEAADMLGVSPQTVSEMVAKHRLIGIKDGREWRFPAWQFTPDSAEPVLPELDRLVREFPGGVVSLSRWMNRPNGNFGGRTPQQEMLHDSDHVFAVINSLTAA